MGSFAWISIILLVPEFLFQNKEMFLQKVISLICTFTVATSCIHKEHPGE